MAKILHKIEGKDFSNVVRKILKEKDISPITALMMIIFPLKEVLNFILAKELENEFLEKYESTLSKEDYFKFLTQIEGCTNFLCCLEKEINEKLKD